MFAHAGYLPIVRQNSLAVNLFIPTGVNERTIIEYPLRCNDRDRVCIQAETGEREPYEMTKAFARLARLRFGSCCIAKASFPACRSGRRPAAARPSRDHVAPEFWISAEYRFESSATRHGRLGDREQSTVANSMYGRRSCGTSHRAVIVLVAVSSHAHRSRRSRVLSDLDRPVFGNAADRHDLHRTRRRCCSVEFRCRKMCADAIRSPRTTDGS